MLSSIEAAARAELAFSYRELARLGLNEGVCNHLTVALPGNASFLVNSHGTPWSEVGRQALPTAGSYSSLQHAREMEGAGRMVDSRARLTDRAILKVPAPRCAQVSAEGLVLVDARGAVLAAGSQGGVVEPTAVSIHAAVHAKLGLGRATAVFHTHMPHATSLACFLPERGRLLPIHQNACR